MVSVSNLVLASALDQELVGSFSVLEVGWVFLMARCFTWPRRLTDARRTKERGNQGD